jgi:serine/threonine-protein kinase
LPGLLDGTVKPANPTEQLEVASLCLLKRWNAAAARFFGEAFTAEPKIAEELLTMHRYNAACAAAQAGNGLGKDTGRLEDKDRARLRRQALDWLRADLEASRKLLDKEANKAGFAAGVAKVMQHWLADPDFIGVRGPEALAKLPEVERPEWQKLWDDVAATLARAKAKTAPEKKSGAK